MRPSDLTSRCPDCGHKPNLYEVTFYGFRFPKFRIECPECGLKTLYFKRVREAIIAWNREDFVEKRDPEAYIDNEGLADMMSKVMSTVYEDYKQVASRENLSRADKVRIREMEEFINENPYMLPYDPGYVIKEIKRQADKKRKEKTRKKQVS